MTGFVVVLAALQLAVPVRCYGQQSFQAELRGFGVTSRAVAFYHRDERERFIALGPDACRSVRLPELWGAEVLAHELAHAWQDDSGLPLSEVQADRIAGWAAPGLLRRLVSVLGRPVRLVRPDPPPVRLGRP